MTSDTQPEATVLITTKNRAGDTCRAVESALGQTADVEVLVIDDGSTDRTSEVLARQFPGVHLVRHDASRGYIVRRNEGVRAASGAFVFSIDDDAIFSSPHVVERTLADFDADPRIGAIAIPCVDIHKSSEPRQPLPDCHRTYATSEFIGTAHAVRRSLFLELGGYREGLVHQGEERDFCLRMLNAGFVVRLGTADPIHHFESPNRDLRRQGLRGRRNDVLFAWQNVPSASLPAHLLGTTFNGLKFGLAAGRPFRMARGLTQGYADILRRAAPRDPVQSHTYSLFRELRRRGAMPITEAIQYLQDDQPAHADVTPPEAPSR